MPLIKCPACENDVSPNAPACPSCGEPIKSSAEVASGAINLKDPVHFLGVIVVGLMALGTVFYILSAI